MIIRIVKMKFQAAAIEEFKQLFAQRNSTIRNFEGCLHLELWQDTNDPSIFFTYSHWQTPEHLEAYRRSDFFRNIWTHTKNLFAAKPEAWSVNKQ